MITIKLLDRPDAFADDISNFAAELDEENKQIKIYHNNEYIGVLKSVFGISIEDFIEKVNKK